MVNLTWTTLFITTVFPESLKEWHTLKLSCLSTRGTITLFLVSDDLISYAYLQLTANMCMPYTHFAFTGQCNQEAHIPVVEM